MLSDEKCLRHVTRLCFMISPSDPMTTPHTCLSCLNSHTTLFIWGTFLQLHRGNCSTGRLGVILRHQKEINQLWSLMKFFLGFGQMGVANNQQITNVNSDPTIDQTPAGQWQPINYGHCSYLWRPQKKKLWQCADSNIKWHFDPVTDAAG